MGVLCIQILQQTKVDRMMPGVLSDYMSSYEWNTFCDSIDRALEPMQAVRTKMMWRNAFVGFMYLIIMITIPVMMMKNPYFIYPGEPGFIIFCVLFPICIVFSFITAFRYGLSKIESIVKDLELVIETENAKRSDVKFALKDNYMVGANTSQRRTSFSHIECTIPGLDIPMGNVIPPADNNLFGRLPVFGTNQPISPGVDGKSAAERLADLNQMKPMLTDEEYNQKRNEILASV